MTKGVLLFLLCLPSAWAQNSFSQLPLNERVLVVYNSVNRDSLAVAKYYMDKRQIPKANLCKIDSDYQEGMWIGEAYEPQVKKPIRACLEKIGKEKILYIVLTYATPYSLVRNSHTLAVDQQIADIWDEYAGPVAFGREVGTQPYFGNAQSQGNAYEQFVPFAKYRDQPLAKTIYSVWRLDAATPELAKGLVDKALLAEKDGLKGTGCFDIRGPIENYEDDSYGAGEWDIHRSAELARRAGFPVVEDNKLTEFGTAPSPLRCDGAALYAGWYALQHYNDAFSWVPGAIGFHSDSGSATSPRKSDNWAGGALLKGITVTSGSVTEPFLEGLVHPDQIFLYLFQGANVGDAVVRGTRWLKWMILNFGDPLYRPFPQGAGPYGSTIYRESWFGLAPQTVLGGGQAIATFSQADRAERDTPLRLSSNKPDLITLPADTMISANSTGVRFPITVKPSGSSATVVITATAGSQTLRNTLILYPLLTNVVVSQTSAKAGTTLNGSVMLFTASHGPDVKVKLVSHSPNVTLPAEITVPRGVQSITFPIQVHAGSAQGSADIVASINGEVKTTIFMIAP